MKTYQSMLEQVSFPEYDKASSKQVGWIKANTYHNHLKADVDFLNFNGEAKLTKDEASQIISLIENNNLDEAKLILNMIRERNAYKFYLSQLVRGGESNE